jgi:hypothetical protein
MNFIRTFALSITAFALILGAAQARDVESQEPNLIVIKNSTTRMQMFKNFFCQKRLNLSYTDVAAITACAAAATCCVTMVALKLTAEDGYSPFPEMPAVCKDMLDGMDIYLKEMLRIVEDGSEQTYAMFFANHQDLLKQNLACGASMDDSNSTYSGYVTMDGRKWSCDIYDRIMSCVELPKCGVRQTFGSARELFTSLSKKGEGYFFSGLTIFDAVRGLFCRKTL